MVKPLTPRARELLEQEDADDLTMRRLAEQLSIRAPSLYKHLPDKAALEAAVIATRLEDLAAVLKAALIEEAEPLVALAAACRVFALSHPPPVQTHD
jgi:AcrR family transcriptional regulator